MQFLSNVFLISPQNYENLKCTLDFLILSISKLYVQFIFLQIYLGKILEDGKVKNYLGYVNTFKNYFQILAIQHQACYNNIIR